MRFLLDENFPKAAAEILRQRGHLSFDIRGTSLEGLDDPDIFLKAQNLEAVLLTTDRDFFHTIPHLFSEHHGVVVIAIRQPSRKGIIDRLEWFLDHVPEATWFNRAFQMRDHTWFSYPPID